MESDKNTLVLFVNGVKHVLADPSTSKTLLSFLRDDLRLTGTKLSCGEGACGACTVTLSKYHDDDNRVTHGAVNACITKLCSLHGCAVTTVEGLGSVEKGLHPVQERIYKCHGSQCGFCTPGMVMAMSSMLREKRGRIEEEDVEVAIQGNLCRCTGYRPIIEGFRTLAKDHDANKKDKLDLEEVSTFDPSTFKPYVSENDDPIFPEELKDFVKNGPSKSFKNGKSAPWFIPSNLEELKEIRTKFQKVEYFAGGTGNYKKEAGEKAEAIIQITNLPELQKMEKRQKGVFFGSSTTMAKLQEFCSSLTTKLRSNEATIFKLLAEVLETWVSAQVRNVASIGGHLGWAHPCSDLTPIFMATGCSVDVLDCQGQVKTIVLDNSFFKRAFQTVLKPGELILGLNVPYSKEGQTARYFRRARRKEFDLPIANAAFFATYQGGELKNVSMAVGGMETVFPGSKASPSKLLEKVPSFMSATNINELNKAKLAQVVNAEVHIDDTAPEQYANYRRCLIAVFVERFLTENGKPTKNEKRPMLSHQLFEKVDPNQSSVDPVTRPIPHNWSAEQATGEAAYIDDMRRLEGEVVVIPIQSKHPRALIESINFDEALKINGVIGYLLPEDVPNNWWGLGAHDEEIIAKEAQYTGQIIGALVCQNEEIGRETKNKIIVDYKARPHVFDLNDVYSGKEKKEIIGIPIVVEKDQGIKPKGKVTSVEGTVHLGGQEHLYLETHRALAIPTGEKDEMIIWSSTQHQKGAQEAVASALKVPRSKITVNCKRAGGGFGGKERPQITVIAAIAAKKFKRPARIVLSTSEDMAVTGHRHNLTVNYKASADETGKIVDAQFEGIMNAGCSLDLSVAVAMNCTLHLNGGYTFKKFKSSLISVKTNTVSNTAYRGFGAPEAAFVVETAMDHLADALKIDKLQLKETNLTKEGDNYHVGDQKMIGCSLDDCWREMMQRSEFERKRNEVDAFNKENKVKKRGLSVIPLKYPVTIPRAGNMQGYAYVRIYTDGSVLLSHGGIEMGQGLNTKMMQVCCRTLGVPIEKVHINCTSTDSIANSTATVASVGTDLNGPAVIDACQQINERLQQIRNDNSSATWEDLVEKAYDKLINLSAIGHYKNPDVTIDFKSNTGVVTSYFTYGVGCIEVEVDCHTGDATVLTADLVMDIGRSLNPAIDIGQVEGAFIQGLGYVTSEQLIMSPKTGEFLTDGPGSYKIPTVADIPRNFNVTLLTHNPSRPTNACYSSKGIGEPPYVLASAVPGAIREAVASYRADHGNIDWFHLNIPVTGDKIRMAATDGYAKEAAKASSKANVQKDMKIGFEV